MRLTICVCVMVAVAGCGSNETTIPQEKARIESVPALKAIDPSPNASPAKVAVEAAALEPALESTVKQTTPQGKSEVASKENKAVDSKDVWYPISNDGPFDICFMCTDEINVLPVLIRNALEKCVCAGHLSCLRCGSSSIECNTKSPGLDLKYVKFRCADCESLVDVKSMEIRNLTLYTDEWNEQLEACMSGYINNIKSVCEDLKTMNGERLSAGDRAALVESISRDVVGRVRAEFYRTRLDPGFKSKIFKAHRQDLEESEKSLRENLAKVIGGPESVPNWSAFEAILFTFDNSVSDYERLDLPSLMVTKQIRRERLRDSARMPKKWPGYSEEDLAKLREIRMHGNQQWQWSRGIRTQ